MHSFCDDFVLTVGFDKWNANFFFEQISASFHLVSCGSTFNYSSKALSVIVSTCLLINLIPSLDKFLACAIKCILCNYICYFSSIHYFNIYADITCFEDTSVCIFFGDIRGCYLSNSSLFSWSEWFVRVSYLFLPLHVLLLCFSIFALCTNVGCYCGR